ncbi:ABC-type uncharacterized transport system involved in gliding motility auxiliary subunit [Alkalispirillum mobile]|uniref:ABC-type uncharacterized transport system involved in gliding motility auxiliary subunit n=1 Tax=Alkalispirillum mobile TaxID=85925 RepID=A0A498BTW6_9GAMM|nr:Gldg family protein [Alkalispirillum mobile]RLK47135.1 ABC-type uncharacterized transport system involved in gliding motility auxiliary subunit [Alkalispirillum mobile]
MRMNTRTRWLLRFNAVLFTAGVLVALAALGWLSQRFVLSWDWTGQQQTALSDESVQLLERLEGTPRITAFVTPDGELATQVERLVLRYRAHAPDLELERVDPHREPERLREAGISHEGELLVQLGDQREHVPAPTEAYVSRALDRLMQASPRSLAWVNDHGQRDLQGQANHDLGQLGAGLEDQGYDLQGLSLVRHPVIPGDTTLLVLSGPQVDLLDGEQQLIQRYLEGGGNLLWLLEPEDMARLPELAETLGVSVTGHPVQDPRTEALLGVDDPGLSLVDDHPDHPVMADIQGPVLLPWAAALEVEPPADWEIRPLLQGADHHELPDRDATTPFLLGATLERPLDDDRRQRVAVIGDGDFLSNQFIGNAGNRKLGLALVDWLTDPGDAEIDYAAPSPDQRLDMGPVAVGVVGFGFLLGLPLLLALLGGLAWWRGRR